MASAAAHPGPPAAAAAAVAPPVPTAPGILIGDRLYSEVSLTIDHSLIPEERLSPTPSMQDGLDLQCETDLRILGCELIQAAGILLRLPQVGVRAAAFPGRERAWAGAAIVARREGRVWRLRGGGGGASWCLTQNGGGGWAR